MLTLGIDIGTSGVRSAVLEGDRLLAQAQVPHRPQRSDRVDANAWWEGVQDCLTAQVAQVRALGRDPHDIRGIAVDGTSGSMVLTDEHLNPVSPALMYNSKGFEEEAARIAACVSGPHIAKGSNGSLARAMRLVTLAERTPKHLMHQADFVAAHLCGRPAGSDYNNALKTGFDPETKNWPAWISDVIAPALLPEVAAPGTALGPLFKDIAQRFDLSPDAQVHAGTTDSIAAFLAAAPMKEGVAVTSLGSTLAIKLLSPRRIDDPQIGLYSHRVGAHWLVGGASNTGGAVLKAYFDDATLARLSAEIDASTESPLDYYPLLQPGERFPVNDPHLPPRVTPRPSEDRDFLHGLLEGMARIEAACFDGMAARGAPRPSAVLTAGGGAKNETWRLIRQRHLGVLPSRAEQDAAAYGVAKLARGGT